MDGPTWAELQRNADTTPKKIRLKLQMISYAEVKYDVFVSIVEEGINFSISNMVSQKNIVNDSLSEDQLTAFLAGPMLGMCFDISHDTNVGGHCDIVVRGPNEMLWLGEAKKYTDYTKLMGGFQQLSDRYATGLANQTCGGMIIYMFGEKVLNMMDNWKAYLLETREGIVTEDFAEAPLQFVSREAHRATEQMLLVRHMPVPLFHKPTDVNPPQPRTRVR